MPNKKWGRNRAPTPLPTLTKARESLEEFAQKKWGCAVGDISYQAEVYARKAERLEMIIPAAIEHNTVTAVARAVGLSRTAVDAFFKHAWRMMRHPSRAHLNASEVDMFRLLYGRNYNACLNEMRQPDWSFFFERPQYQNSPEGLEAQRITGLSYEDQLLKQQKAKTRRLERERIHAERTERARLEREQFIGPHPDMRQVRMNLARRAVDHIPSEIKSKLIGYSQMYAKQRNQS